MIEPGQVFTPRVGGPQCGGPRILITAPVGDYCPLGGGIITGVARAIDYHTGRNPRWISPTELEADYQLDEEAQ